MSKGISLNKEVKNSKQFLFYGEKGGQMECVMLYVVTDQSHVVWCGIPNASFNNGCDLESETPVINHIFTSKLARH